MGPCEPLGDHEHHTETVIEHAVFGASRKVLGSPTQSFVRSTGVKDIAVSRRTRPADKVEDHAHLQQGHQHYLDECLIATTRACTQPDGCIFILLTPDHPHWNLGGPHQSKVETVKVIMKEKRAV